MTQMFSEKYDGQLTRNPQSFLNFEEYLFTSTQRELLSVAFVYDVGSMVRVVCLVFL